jgi:hypothetical protein
MPSPSERELSIQRVGSVTRKIVLKYSSDEQPVNPLRDALLYAEAKKNYFQARSGLVFSLINDIGFDDYELWMRAHFYGKGKIKLLKRLIREEAHSYLDSDLGDKHLHARGVALHRLADSLKSQSRTS